MTTEEKINLLSTYNDIDILSNEQFLILQKFSNDKDETVRSMSAPFLVHFINEDSKKVLFKLAKDGDSLVRTEAYDSLSVFPFKDVEKFLRNAIGNEKDELARRYSILSWIDVVIALSLVNVDNMIFLKNIKNKEQSDECVLSCYYGLYLFGELKYFKNILSFLNNDDYHLKCSVLNYLRELKNNKNKLEIEKAISPLLSDSSIAVKDSAQRLLTELSR
ncbi:MAG: HEAT repeat domain-containing protein [Firmicutes bacterium]|nr:HEAT repeat domain-containing protein [Bacillota bacterium]